MDLLERVLAAVSKRIRGVPLTDGEKRLLAYTVDAPACHHPEGP